ncbi:uncharacterized protein LOC131272891 [Anopheles coustani]|uniref:uncharacterized protein LOC131272891 n=1 Tax=Anopheles coustani TaxID=139045 RepID=UPI002659CABA|nr:uncharacterized protein LOC131272891 [Anopheles coustani]
MMLPVFHQLYDLIMWHYSSLLEETFDICSIAPNLQRISMDCHTENALKVFKHFSHQLKSVKASFKQVDLVASFCKMSFPELLEIEVAFCYSDEFIVSSSNCAFIAGSKRLQRATIKYAKAELFVNILVEHCRDITFLHICSDELENQCLNGLANLTKLTILELEGELECNVFEECQPISSLQELHFVWTFEAIDVEEYCVGYNILEFLKGLPTVMPNLSKLCISECLNDAWLQFIFNNMLSLKCLELNGGWISGGGVHLDTLPHLIELRLNKVSNCDRFFQSFPSTKVRTLSIFFCHLDEDALLSIPAFFPSLRMLHLVCRNARSSEWIEKLRSLMPLCTVIVGNETSKLVRHYY